MFRIDRTLVNLERIEANVDKKSTGSPAVKAAEPVSSSPEADTLKKKQISEIAEEIFNQAAIKAKAILQEAEADAVEIKKLARQRGYEEGIGKADEEIRAAVEKDNAQLRSVIGKIEEARRAMFDSLEDEILGLTFSIVKKVFNQINKSDSAMFESMIANALKQMKKEGKITIRVCKEEYERFFSSGDASFILGDKLLTAAVLPDSNMNGGDCIIESEGETVNAGIDCQMKNIEIAFRQADGVTT